MKTSRSIPQIRSLFLALALAATAGPVPLQAAAPAGNRPTNAAVSDHVRRASAKPQAAFLPAAWYEEILNSRSRTIQAVFILVIVGAFVLRRSN